MQTRSHLSSPAEPSLLRRFFHWPTSPEGAQAVALLVVCLIFGTLFYFFGADGRRATSGFGLDLVLAFSALTAIATGFGAGGLAAEAFFIARDRSGLLLLAMFAGLFVVFFLLGVA